jgi:WD40 repeat protein
MKTCFIITLIIVSLSAGYAADKDSSSQPQGVEENVTTGERLNIPTEFVARLGKGKIREMQFSPDGKYLVLATSIGIWLCDALSLEELAFIGIGSVDTICFSPDGNFLAAAISADKAIKLLDITNRQEIATLSMQTEYTLHPEFTLRFHSIRFSRDGKLLLATAYKIYIRSVDKDEEQAARFNASMIWLWDVESRKEVGTFNVAAYNADGTLFALVVTEDNTKKLKLLNTKTQQFAATLIERSDGIESVVFSDNGKLIAALEKQGLKVWEVESQKIIANIPVHEEGYEQSLHFSPGGKYIALISRESFELYNTSKGDTTTLWDIDTEQVIEKIPGVLDGFSPDGKLISLWYEGYEQVYDAVLYDIKARKEITRMPGGGIYLNGRVFSPDGKLYAVITKDSTIKIWSLHLRKEAATLIGHSDSIHSLLFSPDGKHLVSKSRGKIVLWDVEAEKMIASLTGYKDISSMSFSPDGKLIVTDAGSIWDVEFQAEVANLGEGVPEFSSDRNLLEFSSDGNLLATFDKIALVLWDMKSGEPIEEFIGTVAFSISPNGRLLAVETKETDMEGSLILWDIETRKEVATLSRQPQEAPVCFSPDGKLLVSRGEGAVIKLWDVESRQEVATLPEIWGFIRDIAFSPDGRLIAVIIDFASSKLIDVASWKEVAVLTKLLKKVTSVKFSPDGKLIVAIEEGGAIKFLDVASQKEITALAETPQNVTSISFSPDGSLLALGVDKTIQLWDAKSLKRIGTLIGHTLNVTSISFSSDGQLLASLSKDNTIRLWSAPAAKTPVEVQKVAFVRDGDIWVMKPDGSDQKQLTTDGKNYKGAYISGFYFPIWSSDGEKIFYHYDYGYGNAYCLESSLAIKVMNADGSNQKDFRHDVIEAVSPKTGRLLVKGTYVWRGGVRFTFQRVTQDGDIYDGGAYSYIPLEFRRIPPSRYIFFEQDGDIWRKNADGTNAIMIARNASQPAWWGFGVSYRAKSEK